MGRSLAHAIRVSLAPATPRPPHTEHNEDGGRTADTACGRARPGCEQHGQMGSRPEPVFTACESGGMFSVKDGPHLVSPVEH